MKNLLLSIIFIPSILLSQGFNTGINYNFNNYEFYQSSYYGYPYGNPYGNISNTQNNTLNYPIPVLYNQAVNLPIPIQFNKFNTMSPKVDISCPVEGLMITSYNNNDINNIMSYSNYNTYNWIDSFNIYEEGAMFSSPTHYSFNSEGYIDSCVNGGFWSVPTVFGYFIYDEVELIDSLIVGADNPMIDADSINFSWINNNQICISNIENRNLAKYEFDSFGNLLNYNSFEYIPFDENGDTVFSNGYYPMGPVAVNYPGNLNTTVDTVNFYYDENGLISQSRIKKTNRIYFQYTSDFDTLFFMGDTLITPHNNDTTILSEITLDYNWVNQNQVEIDINYITENSNSGYNLGSAGYGVYMGPYNNQEISKIIIDVDSNKYGKNITYLDSNLNILINYDFQFCDDDSLIFGCLNPAACNFDTTANYNSESSSISYNGQPINNPCYFEYDSCGQCGGNNFPEPGFDCFGNCISGRLVTVDVFGSLTFNVSWELNGIEGVSNVPQQVCLDDGCHFLNLETLDGNSWFGTQATVTLDENNYNILNENLAGTYYLTGSNTQLAFPLNYKGFCGVVYGCTDSLACNFNEYANNDDESCIYPEQYYDCYHNCINDFDQDGECDEYDYDDGLGINKLNDNSNRLIKMIDVLGKEHKLHPKGLILFYIYENGEVKKRYNN